MGMFSRLAPKRRARRENGRTAPRSCDLAPGRTYIVEEPSRKASFDLFVELTSSPSPDGTKRVGLIVSRLHPDMIRQDYSVEDARIYWLAARAGDAVISPNTLGVLASTLARFADENPGAVMLLDGLEYLISNNDFDKVMRMIDQVSDHVSQSRSNLIVPVDKRALSARELATLERKAERIVQPGSDGCAGSQS